MHFPTCGGRDTLNFFAAMGHRDETHHLDVSCATFLTTMNIVVTISNVLFLSTDPFSWLSSWF